MSDKPELLPCPFCGSKRILLDWDLYETEEGRRHRSRIKCMECRLEPKIFKTHADARSYWNTRAAPAEDVRAVVDEPVAYLHRFPDNSIYSER